MSANLKLITRETDVERLAALRNELPILAMRIAMHQRHLDRFRQEWTAKAEEARELEESFERRRRTRLRDEMPVMQEPITFEFEEAV